MAGSCGSRSSQIGDKLRIHEMAGTKRHRGGPTTLQYVPSYSQSLRWVFVPARPPSMMTIDKPSGTTRACPHFGITHPHIHPSNTGSHPAKQSLHSLGPRSRNHHVTDDRGPRAAVWQCGLTRVPSVEQLLVGLVHICPKLNINKIKQLSPNTSSIVDRTPSKNPGSCVPISAVLAIYK